MRSRALGWGLIVYGVLGIALVVSGATIGLGVAARIERLATSADDTIAAAARSTRIAATSFISVDASLENGQTSAEEAATLARETSFTLDQLASAMEISIFGAQPLLPLGNDFATSAEQAAALAITLDEVASSLDETRADVSEIGVELTTLSLEIESLQTDARTAQGGPQLRLFVLLLLAWITVPALGALILGVAVLRMPRVAATP